VTSPRHRPSYSRFADIPPDVLASLSAGRDDAHTLSEWLAIDMAQLVRAIAPEVGLAGVRDDLGVFADSVAGEGVTRRNVKIGAELHRAARESGRHGGVFEAVATHRSGAVRMWAASMVRADDSLALDERLRRARRFATDPHMLVREAAWESFRPYLIEELDYGLILLAQWVRDPEPHVRRCAVEGSRPRGVWTQHIERLKEDPTPGLPILEPVRSDPDRYAARAVANWINDASWAHPDWVVELTSRWLRESPTDETRWIVNHATRTLRKQVRDAEGQAP